MLFLIGIFRELIVSLMRLLPAVFFKKIFV